MRIFVLITGLALGAGMLGTTAEAACNVRGEFCGYPAWAANAFSNPRDRVPDWWLENPPGQRAYREERDNRNKRYRHRRR